MVSRSAESYGTTYTSKHSYCLQPKGIERFERYVYVKELKKTV